MTNYYVDFVGLNTFLYETVGWDPTEQGKIDKVARELKQTNEDAGYTLVDSELLSYEHGSLANRRWGMLELNHIGNNVLPEHSSIAVSSIAKSIRFYKNDRFPINLNGTPQEVTASLFPILMLHRNGPYGFPTWRQIRVGQNPLTRRQVKENILTIVQEPGSEFTFTRNSKTISQKAKYGNILKFSETPVLSKFKPVVVYGSTITEKGTKRVSIAAPLGNAISQFNNAQLNEELGLVNIAPDLYEEAKELYLNGALLGGKSPLDIFEIMTYGETVYPPQIYTYKNHVRQRTTFSFPWRDNRTDRQPLDTVPNGFGSDTKESVWVMDAYSGYDSAATNVTSTSKGFFSGYLANISVNTTQSNSGILQNQYSFAEDGLAVSTSFSDLDGFLRPAPIYNRKHIITPSSSAANINGMNIEGINFGSLFTNIHISQLPAGEAKWEAGSQSGKNPFYDSYGDFIQGPRQLGKDHSIIPEFRISNHVSFYETKSPIDENLNIFELTGGLLNTTSSNEDNFYEIYSNSDFMKNFEMVLNDNESMGEPLKITLKCNAIKKLLPYEGFYPQQRTVQIAEQFFNSYSASLAMSGTNQTFTGEAAKIGLQNVLTPLFAPGIMYNSIKSGVAVDYPVISGLLGTEKATNKMVLNQGDDFYCSFSGSDPVAGAAYSTNDGLIFDKRIAFETLIKPETLQGIELFCNEPDIITNHSSSTTINSVAGDRLYTLMTHNFLAETSNFFLQNKSYTTFFSKPSNELKQFEAGKDYMMRVKMYKTTSDAQISNVSGGVGTKFFTAPQYSNNSRENFTMYSRPTAFGPSTLITSSLGFVSYSAPSMGFLGTGEVYIGNRSDKGENYPFTPPYYHGQAWADIKFTPTQDGTYTAKDIQRSASIAYYRYVHPDTDTGENIFDMPIGESKLSSPAYIQNNFYNKNALQLSASVNLLSIERDQSGDLNEETARLVVQSKWESPMLNFAHLSASDSVTLPNNASQSVPRGMWHQYGRIEEDQAKGVFLQIEDIDPNWLTNILGKDTGNIRSLADQLDFSTKPKRMGEVANEKVIKEAVVAVPFIEAEGLRKYFHIPREDIANAILANNGAGDSVANMINKMRDYVFPPSMDFLTTESIEPFAMYIFEFSQTLSKQDLADIWQGLYPSITSKFEAVRSEISHPLLAQELLGGGATVLQQPGGKVLDTSDKGTPLPSKIRWMVFKVKQRATTNYWRSVIGTEGDKLQEVPRNTFNWPYDFFSLVELAKLDAEVAIGQFEPGGLKTLVKPQGKITEAAVPVSEALTEEAQSSVTTGVPGGTTAIAPGSGGTQGSAPTPPAFATQAGSNLGQMLTRGYDRSKPREFYSCEQLKAFRDAGIKLRARHNTHLNSFKCEDFD